MPFDLPQNLIDYVNCMYLQLPISNAAVGQADLTDGFSMIDYVQIEANGIIVQVDWGSAMRKNFCLLADLDSKFAGAAAAVYISPTTFNSTLNIAGAGSATVSVPIYQTLFSVADVPLSYPSNINWRLTIRFKTRSTNIMRSISVAAIADISVNNPHLVITGQVLSEQAKFELVKSLRNKDCVYRYYTCSREQLSLGTVVSGTTTQANFSAQGQLSFCHLDLRNQTVAAAEENYTASALTSFEMLSNGQVVSHNLGDNAYTYTLYKCISPEYWPNQALLAAKNNASIIFSENPVETLRHGTNYGFRRCSGQNEVIRVVPGANIVSARLDTFCYWHSTLLIDYRNGLVTPQRQNVEY